MRERGGGPWVSLVFVFSGELSNPTEPTPLHHRCLHCTTTQLAAQRRKQCERRAGNWKLHKPTRSQTANPQTSARVAKSAKAIHFFRATVAKQRFSARKLHGPITASQKWVSHPKCFKISREEVSLVVKAAPTTQTHAHARRTSELLSVRHFLRSFQEQRVGDILHGQQLQNTCEQSRRELPPPPKTLRSVPRGLQDPGLQTQTLGLLDPGAQPQEAHRKFLSMIPWVLSQ